MNIRALVVALSFVASGFPAARTAVVPPKLTDTWQWQLLVDGSHPLNTSYAATVYDVDLEGTSKETIASLKSQGRYVVCYFSAGTYEPYRSDSGEFKEDDKGSPLDPPFGDERWIDVSSSGVRSIMGKRLDRARDKGCQAVEPDNVDAWANENGLDITGDDQLDYNKFIASQAHQRGLAVGLKNDLDQIPSLVAHFDFAVNEQCFEHDECDSLKPFLDAGKPVFNAEYAKKYRLNTNGARDKICKKAKAMRGMHTLVLPILLDDEFRCSCDGGGQKKCSG